MIVGAVAVAVRVGYVLAFMRGYVPNSDADSYFKIGQSVANGHGYAFTLPFEYVHATAIRAPLFPTVLAGAFRVFGAHIGVAQGINIAAGSAAAVLGALIAQRVGGSRAALCAGLVIALYPPLIANDVTVLVESIALMLLFAAVLFLLDGRTAWAGVALGLLMLDRASAQWFLLVIGAWVVWRFGWLHAARLVVIALLVVAPWVVRNTIMVGGPVIVATNGFNLNASYSNEARFAHGFVDGYLDLRFATARIDATDEVDLDAALRRRALRDLRAHPDQLAAVTWTNTGKWPEFTPGKNQSAEQLDGRNLDVRHWTLPLFYLVTAAGLFALVRARRSAAAQLLAIAAGYFTLISLFSIAVPRLRSLFDGCMAVGAGLALAWALAWRVTVAPERPRVRPVRIARSIAILATVAIVMGGTGLVWRAHTQHNAHRDIAGAVTRDAPGLGALAGEYRAGVAAGLPPKLQLPDLDRLHDLVNVLGDRAPQASPTDKAAVDNALYDIRVAWHEADVLGLFSAGEYLEAAEQHRTPTVDAVRNRYDNELRRADATLESYDSVVTGAPLERAQTTLDQLREQLAS